MLLFPEPLSEGLDRHIHFCQNSRWFFALGAGLPLSDALDTALKGREHFRTQGTIYPVTILLLFAMNVTACRRRNAGLHAFFASFA